MKNETEPSQHAEEVHRAQASELSNGVVGVFDAPFAANEAFEVLMDLGYQPGEIGIMIAEETKRRFWLPSLLTHPAESDETKVDGEQASTHVEKSEARAVLQGAGAVSAIGALGGLLVAATAAVLIPGFGLLLIGPLAGMGAGFGAFVGGVYAVPAIEAGHADQATHYETEVRAGKVLIHVTPRNSADEIQIRKAWDRIQGITKGEST